jgi:hypothetical protein
MERQAVKLHRARPKGHTLSPCCRDTMIRVVVMIVFQSGMSGPVR